MTALLLALGASGAWGLSDFLGGLRTRTLALPLVLACSQLAGLVTLVAALVVTGRSPSGGLTLSGAAWAAVAGAAGAGALGLLYVVLARAGVVLIAPISAGAAVVAALGGLARGQPLTPLTVAGFALAVAGVVAVTAGGGGCAPGELPGRLVAAAAAAALCAGVFFVAISVASAEDPLGATLVNRVAACALVVAWAVGRGRSGVGANAGALTGVVVVGVADAVAELCFAAASARAPLAVVTPLASLYPAVAVVLAMVVLRERPRALALLGIVAAAAGVGLLGGSV